MKFHLIPLKGIAFNLVTAPYYKSDFQPTRKLATIFKASRISSLISKEWNTEKDSSSFHRIAETFHQFNGALADQPN